VIQEFQVPREKLLDTSYQRRRNSYTSSRSRWSRPQLSKLEFQIIEVRWERGESSIREILDSLPAEGRPAYNTIQTMVYRMEPKGVVRRIKKVGNFHIFAASISRDVAQRRLIEELLALFGVRSQPVMAHLVDAGKVSLEDVKEAERALRKLSGKEKQS
jgi:BlaI family penicillinase repressor